MFDWFDKNYGYDKYRTHMKGMEVRTFALTLSSDLIQMNIFGGILEAK